MAAVSINGLIMQPGVTRASPGITRRGDSSSLLFVVVVKPGVKGRDPESTIWVEVK